MDLDYVKELFLRESDKIKSKLINKKDPIIHRIYIEDGDVTYMVQKVLKSKKEEYYMHSHSWDIELLLLKGIQELGYGFSEERLANPECVIKHYIKAGDKYSITSESVYHYTKPLTDYTISVSMIGKRKRDALSTNTGVLTDE